MNDRTIINAISKIHFNIVSLLTFVTLAFFLFFTVLQQGITVEKLILPGFKITQLYIKWDQKLTIAADELSVTRSDIKHRKLDLSLITDTLDALRWIDGWIESVNIKSIRINDARATFRYNMGDKGYFSLTSPYLAVNSDLDVIQHRLIANINRFSDTQRDIHISGRCTIDLDTMTSYSKLKFAVGDTAELNVYLRADQHALAFEATSQKPISRLRPIVDLFKLPANITPWIVDYAIGKELHLHSLKGSFPYSDPAALLGTLYANATYDDLAYTFKRNIEPIITRTTEIVFEKGVLNIYPQDASFYAHDGGKSWLNIDFNPKSPVLTARILTDARLDNDILYLLEQYNIKLPFRQLFGKTGTDLTLAINLRTLAVEANGTFLIKEGIFYYDSAELAVTDADIALRNTEITINALTVAYDDLITAQASGKIDLKRHLGGIDIISDSINIDTPKGPITLDKQTPLKLHYRIAPKNDAISLSGTRWRFESHTIGLDGFDTPFDFEHYAMTVPPTGLSVDGAAEARFSGEMNLAKKYANFKADVLTFNYRGLELKQSDFPLKLFYSQKLKIAADVSSIWSINGMPLELSPFSLSFDKGRLTLDDSHFTLDNSIKTRIEGSYSAMDNNGSFALKNISIANPAWGTLFSTDRKIDLTIASKPGTLQITAPDLRLDFTVAGQGWKAVFSDLGRIARYSNPLYDYNVTNGTFSIESSNGSFPHRFKGTLHYPYPVIIDKNEPLYDYTFAGVYDSNITNININENIAVRIADSTYSLYSNTAGYNLGAILAFIEDHDRNETGAKKPPFVLEADSSFIYFTPDRKAVADKITLNSNETGLYARLYHKEGTAVFEMHDKNFYLYGQDFGDSFMSHLLALAEYKNGSMSFQIGGDTRKSNGFLHINGTTVKDYKVLNNVLAFVNTIPSLATFSLPHYSKEGIKVSEAYADFTYEAGKVTVKGVKVDSHEINIAGGGVIDYKNNLLDMELNLITDLGSTLGKVPLVGYILLGDDGSIATTLKLSGTLDDPKVKTAIAKDIVVAPFNIIKRTLTFPFKLFKGKKDDKEE